MGKADAIDCSKDVPLTQQSAKEECDINFIVERAKRGADLSQLARGVPQYGDFTSIPTDLRECLVIVQKANNAFMQLDAQVRKRFENDPAQMIDFLNDPNNRDEAVKLGLVVAPKEPPAPSPELETLKSIEKSLKSSKKAKADEE